MMLLRALIVAGLCCCLCLAGKPLEKKGGEPWEGESVDPSGDQEYDIDMDAVLAKGDKRLPTNIKKWPAGFPGALPKKPLTKWDKKPIGSKTAHDVAHDDDFNQGEIKGDNVNLAFPPLVSVGGDEIPRGGVGMPDEMMPPSPDMMTPEGTAGDIAADWWGRRPYWGNWWWRRAYGGWPYYYGGGWPYYGGGRWWGRPWYRRGRWYRTVDADQESDLLTPSTPKPIAADLTPTPSKPVVADFVQPTTPKPKTI